MAEPSQLEALARKFRAQVLAQERAAANQLVRRYGQAWRALSARAAETAATVAADIALGGTPTPAHLYQHRRVLAMRSLVEQEIGQFARFADLAVQASQSEAVEAARTHAAELLGAALEESAPGLTAGFEAVSTEALSDLVGFLSDGSPLARLFAQLGPDAGLQASQALVDGLVRGLGPRDVARHMRDALGGNMTRALTISRTEMLRSYRESSQRSYRANSDVVAGWVWTSALGGRTCSACWAEHGSLHPLDETMSSHPRCRCSPVPQTKTWSDMGFTGLDETRYEPRRGPDLFAGLDEATQRAVLGPGKFAAYRDGKIELGDLVERRHSPAWGTTTSESSLRRAQERAAARVARAAPSAPAPTVRPTLTDDQWKELKPRWDLQKRERVLKKLKATPDGKLLADTLTRFQGGPSRGIPAFRTDVAKRLSGEALEAGRAARVDNFLGALRHAPTDMPPKTLYRGMHLNESADDLLARYKPGTVVDLNVSSFSSSRDLANGFRLKPGTKVKQKAGPDITASGAGQRGQFGKDSTGLRMELIGEGKRALPIENISRSRVFAEEKEWVTGGRFVVEDAKRDAGGVVIRIRQERTL